MSTLRVSSIKNASSATGGLDIAADGVVSGALPSPNRNLLYNGAMQVAQRGTSTTGITTTGYYTADRWNVNISSLGTWTQDIQNDAPSGSGFRSSLRMLCTTADAAPAGDDRVLLSQLLEGQDLQRIRKGTSAAQTLTLSFWVKTNVVGTYVIYFADIDNTRQVGAQYTIASGDSGNWVRRVVTIAADTTGAFDNDNAASLRVGWWLASGSNRTSGTFRSSWSSEALADVAAGQTANVAAATNNYWQITGVQLEVGDTATGFEFKSYGQELAECQRYYYRITANTAFADFAGGFCNSTTQAQGCIAFPVSMRTNPTALEQSGTAADYAVLHSSGGAVARVTCSSVPLFETATTNSARFRFIVASGLTAGNGSISGAGNNTVAYLAWSAEL